MGIEISQYVVSTAFTKHITESWGPILVSLLPGHVTVGTFPSLLSVVMFPPRRCVEGTADYPCKVPIGTLLGAEVGTQAWHPELSAAFLIPSRRWSPLSSKGKKGLK